jgi:16S rRNA (adenine1518-N6/adenine1519-N6)-dimethyltransferase
MAQGRADIQGLLEAAGIRPLKQYGQHFLVDANLLMKLVAAAEVSSGDVVLEAGPGTGVLTERLLEVSGQVVAVEIDRGLQAICRERFANSANFQLISRDILQSKSVIAPDVLEALRAHQARLGGRIMLVANLPYQVASALVIDLLLESTRVSPLCFTVQAEVAERLAAPPGGKDYGPLSVMAQTLAEVRRIARVPPQAFWPVPKVDSAMVRLDAREAEKLLIPVEARGDLAALVQGCFQHRRKTLRANLREILPAEVLAAVGDSGSWDLAKRPEQLSPAQWVALTMFVRERGWRSGTARSGSDDAESAEFAHPPT